MRGLRPRATVSDGRSREAVDESRMHRICDKLIGVFMVDKPTPTDWRRLLAFSREWDNLKPQFFARCQERADAEKDPAMKEKTPEKLHTWIKSVVDAYHLSREGSLIREARDLMRPEIIQKLEVLKMVVERNFM
ncbi:hypothetical protein V8G54_034607 [Vigna mungo]|uniref:Uncharacterized protein n=1 Tax=Vigna mungo TaxID=3915 RepID=A0AAQ3MRY7_VIGMU